MQKLDIYSTNIYKLLCVQEFFWVLTSQRQESFRKSNRCCVKCTFIEVHIPTPDKGYMVCQGGEDPF